MIKRAALALGRLVALVGCLALLPALLRADGPGIANVTYASNELFARLAAFTSTNGAPRGHGLVAMHRGYLVVIFSDDGGGGNGSGGFTFFNMSNPRAPIRTFTTYNNSSYSSSSANYAGDIREAHGFSFWQDYVCLPSNKSGGSGLQFWDWSTIDPPNPTPIKIGSVILPGLTGGDYSPTPWWVFWQGGRYAYVAGTSGGLYIVDASNPTQPVLLNRGAGLPNPIPTSQTGGFRINTVFAIGNLLVVAGSDVNGITTFDISDPANPVLLATINSPVGYSMMVNGNRILGAHDPARVWDITNPASITSVATGPNVADKGGYGVFQDGIFHYGSSSAYVKLDIRTVPFTVVGTHTPSGFSNADWDFATPLGNLAFLGNDHSGSALVVHQTARDTTGPSVNMVVPRNGATNQALGTRVGLTFTDQIDLRSVNTNTCTIRPVGGNPLPGRYSYQTGIINFWPDQPLQPTTTYEVIVAAGGIHDLVSNTVPTTFTSRFSTMSSNLPLSCSAQPAAPATPGQPVNFTATAIGSGTPQFSWNFGDETPPTDFSPNGAASHTYSAPGHYNVIVTVTNATAQSSCSFIQTIHLPRTPVQPTTSSTILFDAVSNRVWNVNADTDTVTAINATTFAKLFEVSVGKNPRTLAQAPDGTIWVVNQTDATISILNRATGGAAQAPISLPRGSRPYGIAFSPNGTAAYVTLQGVGRLLRLNPATRTVTGDLDVGPTPRGIAISGDSQRIFVTRFISPDTAGEIREVDAATFTVVRTFSLALDPGPDREDASRGLPNYISSLTISPDGRHAWIPSKKDNIQRGSYRENRELNFESTVRTIVSRIDLETNAEDLSARIDLNDRDMAFATRFSPLGDYLFVAVQGANSVDVFDVYTGELVTALEETGLAPQGLVLSPDGRRLFVQNFMSRTVKVYDISGIVGGTGNLAPELATVAAVSNEILPPQVLLGKQIFYNAHDRRMNRDSYISCASCHLDGGHDGRVWDFTDRGEGLRNTVALIGRSGMGQGRVHWTANFDEIQDFEHDIRGPFAGTGFLDDALFEAGTRNQTLGDSKAGLSPELDALAAYVASLTNVNRSPFRNANNTLTSEAVAGKAIFTTAQCASCHTGNQFTDSSAGILHDVGTIKPGSGKRLGEPLTGIDTPTLKGVWETAPYFHDGSAATLTDVFASGHHAALTTSLSAEQKQQLIAYLLQIDDSEIVNARPTVVISRPANNSWFTLPAHIVLATIASDSDGTIRSVEFFANGAPIGQATIAPFSIIWSNATPGVYQLTARVTDNLGDFAVSSAVNVLVNSSGDHTLNVNFQTTTAPVPSGYWPDFGDAFGARDARWSYGWNSNTFETRYRTNPSNPSPDSRYATLNHLQKPSNPNASWEITLPNGAYRVHAVSGDADNTDGRFHLLAEGVTVLNGAPASGSRWVEGTATVSVADGRLTVGNGSSATNNKICFIDITSLALSTNSAPSVTLTNPANAATFEAPAGIVIGATATDIAGTVVRVDFFANGAWLGATITAPHRFTWDNVPEGSYTLRAQAIDNYGATSVSSPVTISVGPPEVRIISSFSSGILNLSLNTAPGRTYTVQFTDSLAPPSWQPLQTLAGAAPCRQSPLRPRTPPASIACCVSEIHTVTAGEFGQVGQQWAEIV